MRLLDAFKECKNIALAEKLCTEKYDQQYFEECRIIWRNFVPKSGQADSLQGEMLRQIEKLRYEAQNNGNINWEC